MANNIDTKISTRHTFVVKKLLLVTLVPSVRILAKTLEDLKLGTSWCTKERQDNRHDNPA